MSEYQYYEFVAIDRPLDERQLDEVRALSTRAHITPTSFVNTYEWGNFRGDPRVLMERYYDAFLYLTNWGTRWLSFRVPSRLLDLPTAQRYCVGDAASARVSGEHVVIDLVSGDQETDDFEWGGEGWLSGIVPARAELVFGDLRLLYLAWLLCVQTHEVPDEEELPVPAGLGKLTGSLKSVAEFLRIDPDLLAVAQRASIAAAPAEDMAAWVASLPAAEKDAALLTLLRGDDPHLRAGLLRRFRGAAPAQPGNRTAGELRAAAEARWKDRVRAEEERKRRAAEDRERERAAKRARRLAALAADGDRAWTRVDAMIETKKPAEYDRAVDLLEDLREVAKPAEFARRVGELRVRHVRKSSLMDRFDRAGL
ncbi:hypothetical protein K1T35_11335 [Pseudonocardia sp. DSM 110487]|uniref:hypothetical protein n=1 Tax=Pseudonocardia sp. DSM 110487 TaxID=2865833 RepID=UPI001C69694C|nr:hypothetical protein [Pseudonocardia sp. DSM 110487]QYN37774.1 hypothetical protein K1T35_11335 [Pseudonocardia sp. DSM 110487]